MNTAVPSKSNSAMYNIFVHCTYFHITAWRRVLHDKLTVIQIVKGFPTFYGTQTFTTVFTRDRHRSLS